MRSSRPHQPALRPALALIALLAGGLSQHLKICARWLLCLCVLGLSLSAAAAHSTATTTLYSAQLSSRAGERTVQLPNVLEPRDYDAQGSFVRYQLHIYLPTAPTEALGLYVPKLSLSGKVSINGKLLESCAIGPLEQLRCLHRPYLFVAPPEFWQAGDNTIDFDIYATSRQMNGLSSVTIGDPQQLNDSIYRQTYWFKVDLLVGLAWLSALSGLLSLSVALVMRREPVYYWFGLVCITNALSLFNGFIESPSVNIEVYNWFVFSVRLISVPMLFTTFFALFGKGRRWLSRLVTAFIIAAPIAVWLSDNDRTFVFLLYLPWVIAAFPAMGMLLNWAWRSKERVFWIYALVLPVLFVTGTIDWLRLGGETQFEGVFLVPYSSTILLLIVWGIIINGLVRSTEQGRLLRQSFETRLRERQLYEQARTQDRERLLQDMHDGFGSQLAGLNLLAEQGRIPSDEFPERLKELMSDLYLVVDTLGHGDPTFDEALIDMRYRLQGRFEGISVALHWDIRLRDLPKLDQRISLHILRIIQEALNNALKHAHSHNVWIGAVYEPASGFLTVTIRDDGRGLPSDVIHGRGLYNMRTRAREAGADIVIENTASGGVEVRLRVDTLKVAAEKLAAPELVI